MEKTSSFNGSVVDCLLVLMDRVQVSMCLLQCIQEEEQEELDGRLALSDK